MMPGRELVTRQTLKRELAKNAATKPVTVLVSAAVVVAGLLLGTLWLLPVALVLYLGLAAATFFDAGEAARVGEAVYERARGGAGGKDALVELSPHVAAPLEAARAEAERIRTAIARARLPFTEVSVEVDSLIDEMERIAGKAQLIDDYIGSQDPAATERRLRELRDGRGRSAGAEVAAANEGTVSALEDKLRVQRLLQGELDRFGAEMEHLVASLGVVHGQLVRMSVVEESSLQQNVAEEVRELRERVGALTDGLSEAYGELSAQVPT